MMQVLGSGAAEKLLQSGRRPACEHLGYAEEGYDAPGIRMGPAQGSAEFTEALRELRRGCRGLRGSVGEGFRRPGPLRGGAPRNHHRPFGNSQASPGMFHGAG